MYLLPYRAWRSCNKKMKRLLFSVYCPAVSNDQKQCFGVSIGSSVAISVYWWLQVQNLALFWHSAVRASVEQAGWAVASALAAVPPRHLQAGVHQLQASRGNSIQPASRCLPALPAHFPHNFSPFNIDIYIIYRNFVRENSWG